MSGIRTIRTTAPKVEREIPILPWPLADFVPLDPKASPVDLPVDLSGEALTKVQPGMRQPAAAEPERVAVGEAQKQQVRHRATAKRARINRLSWTRFIVISAAVAVIATLAYRSWSDYQDIRELRRDSRVMQESVTGLSSVPPSDDSERMVVPLPDGSQLVITRYRSVSESRR